ISCYHYLCLYRSLIQSLVLTIYELEKAIPLLLIETYFILRSSYHHKIAIQSTRQVLFIRDEVYASIIARRRIEIHFEINFPLSVIDRLGGRGDIAYSCTCRI